MKKNSFVLLLCLFFSLASHSQEHYWVCFKDKNNSSYSVKEPAAFLSAKAIERRAKQNILITENDLPPNTSYISAVKSTGAKVSRPSRWFNSVVAEISGQEQLDKILSLDCVKSVKLLSAPSIGRAADKFAALQSSAPGNVQRAAVYNYGHAYDQVHMINADCMHNIGYRGEGIVIAVLDGGFFKVDSLPAFDSLRNQNGILGCRDFVDGDTMVYEDYQHGMNVLSCMAANLPGRIVGTAPKAKYWLLRTETVFSETLLEEINWAAGAEFADSVGADIINSSLGYSYFDNSADNHSYADMDGNTTIVTNAADLAVSKGMFVVCSAGNSGGAPWYKITAPADADSVLTVGAVDSIQNIAAFSSRGPTFDGRVKPDVVAKGVDAAIAAAAGDVTRSGGTSFSAPITAGAVACLWQAHPSKTNMELLEAVRQSSNQSSIPDSIKGYGVPNFCVADYILVGINEPNQPAQELNIFPNPFSTTFTVSIVSQKSDDAVIIISDIAGRLISRKNVHLEQGANNLQVETISTLAPGSYIFSLRSSGSTHYKKIIKNK